MGQNLVPNLVANVLRKNTGDKENDRIYYYICRLFDNVRTGSLRSREETIMPKLEQHAIQEDRLWYHAEVTEEQLEEFKQAEANDEEFPDWVWELDWDLEHSKPGNDDVMYIKAIDD